MNGDVDRATPSSTLHEEVDCVAALVDVLIDVLIDVTGPDD